MDFGWSLSQQELYDQTLRFARHELRGLTKDSPGFSRAAWRALGEFGALGACLPESVGGQGFDALTTARVVEALGQGSADLGLIFSASAHLFACAVPINAFATDALRAEVLPRLASGEWVGANAITEAGAGSDVFALKTTATRDSDVYVLDGEKSYVSNGPQADQILVYASTAPKHGYLGISAFVVDATTPGVVIGSPFAKTGLHRSPICQVYFQSARVPAHRRLGAEGDGASIFHHSMAWERACLFASYVGGMARDLDTCVAYANNRRQFRKSIGRHQSIAHRLADMKLRLESARLLLYRACWQLDQGHDNTLEVSLAKLAISESAIQSGLDLIHIHGGLGFMAETGLDTSLRDALGSTIFSGTSEIQRDLIAKGLGL
ncbi:MAG: alkylation response protein AidB-like acyl-CoA dehydrogenase [Myxococcota bacterium]|jgi:alkylation response protein AidB-like acyl-CoA dehydrogenase